MLNRKPMRKVISIDSVTSAGDPQPPSPASALPRRKSSSNSMTRRTFAGLFFGLGQSFHTATRNSSITRTAASEVAFEHGYDEWLRRTGRKVA